MNHAYHLRRITRCRGCGSWRYAHGDYRQCGTCAIKGHRDAIERIKGTA